MKDLGICHACEDTGTDVVNDTACSCPAAEGAKFSTYVREVDRGDRSNAFVSLGRAAIYKLSEPFAFREDRSCTHVFVSSTTVMGTPETYAFPSDEDGKVLDWLELDGSQKGAVTHEVVLRDMGFPVRTTDTSSTERGE